MVGRIRAEDIVAVREVCGIADVVGELVQLRPAGGGSLKGLCPFHDERTPSFNVTPARGFYHCFGCGEGGDVITFVERTEQLSFSEAVEKLARRVGITLRYEESGPAVRRPADGRRPRLVAAHAAAAEFYGEQLASPEAAGARQFLTERGFDLEFAATFGCGYSPPAWDRLTRHLLGRGFALEELTTAGLSRPGRTGSHGDRFRGRLMWPIRDLTGDVVGFGARRLTADESGDSGPKYLNTPETPIYHKSQVLYGVDLAKREIARRRQAVVVEGYTDVMACHAAGVPTAVATCGTAFGPDHVAILRRLLMDSAGLRGEVIFTFDGDEAGRKAALRAFEEDQRFLLQTFVAIEPDGIDPCELRLTKGDVAVRDLVARRRPLVEFVLRSLLAQHDLDTAEGRVSALRQATPVVAKIKDTALRPEYVRRLAGDLGLELATVREAVARATREMVRSAAANASDASAAADASGSSIAAGSSGPGRRQMGGQKGAQKGAESKGQEGSSGSLGAGGSGGGAADRGIPDSRQMTDDRLGRSPSRGGTRTPGDSVGGTSGHAARVPPARGSSQSGSPARSRAAAAAPSVPRTIGKPRLASVEREALKLVLQEPALADPWYSAEDQLFEEPEHRAVAAAIAAAGWSEASARGGGWVTEVLQRCPDDHVRSLVTALAVEPTRSTSEPDSRYVAAVFGRLQEARISATIADLKSRLQRVNPIESSQEYSRLFGELVALEQVRRGLREQAIGAL